MAIFWIIAVIAGLIVVLLIKEGRSLSYEERKVGRWAFTIAAIAVLLGLVTTGVEARPNAVQRIANQYNVPADAVEFREDLPEACTRYNCYTYKAIVFVWGKRVGIVEYSDGGSVQFTEDTPGYKPETPPPTATPVVPGTGLLESSVVLKAEAQISEIAIRDALKDFEIKNNITLPEETKLEIIGFLGEQYGYITTNVNVVFTPTQPLNYEYLLRASDTFAGYYIDETCVVYIPVE